MGLINYQHSLTIRPDKMERGRAAGSRSGRLHAHKSPTTSVLRWPRPSRLEQSLQLTPPAGLDTAVLIRRRAHIHTSTHERTHARTHAHRHLRQISRHTYFTHKSQQRVGLLRPYHVLSKLQLWLDLRKTFIG
jgi:hypothetical protein